MKKKLYQARSKIAKALAHEIRLEIVDILREKEALCVCEITEILGTSQSSVSKHLSVLKDSGILDSKKEGLNVSYFLRTPCVVYFFNCLDNILEQDIKKRKKELDLL